MAADIDLPRIAAEFADPLLHRRHGIEAILQEGGKAMGWGQAIGRAYEYGAGCRHGGGHEATPFLPADDPAAAV